MATSETNTSSKVYPSGAAPFWSAPGEEMVGDDATAQVIQEILAGEGVGIVEAAKKFPRGRGGSPVSPTTVSRHINHGVRLPNGTMVKLAAAKFGSKVWTSFPAIARFMMALTSAGLPATRPSPATCTTTVVNPRRVKAANDRLAASGL